MTESNLEKLRRDIDSIDEKITALFKERMKIALEVAKYKKEKNLPVMDAAREQAILSRVSEQIGEPFDGCVRMLFNTIFDASRACQNSYLRYGLLGESLAHSYSKEIHEALGRYTYDLFSLPPEEMPDFVRARDFAGLNVTIPYKQDVMALCDEVSELAAAIGAVNTLYRKDGKLVGHNTDYEGFLYTAKRADIDFAGKTALILGSGGTSLTVRKAALDQGAAKVYVATRQGGAANGASSSGGTRIPATVISYDALPDISQSIDIIINTTPVGTFPDNDGSIISLADFPNCAAVIDVVYNPFKTRLLLDAEKAGLKCAGGLPMLVAQATAAAGYFLGTPGAFTGENERIIGELTDRMRNIVLIGMPGSGKTTIGKILAEETGKRFVDMDEEIVKKAGKPIPQIFDEAGEKGFRDLESETAMELGRQHGLIIATGGGAVLRQENVDALKQNGYIIHVRRSIDSLQTEGRPLSKNIETLREIERIRMPLYTAAADRIFDNTSDLAALHANDLIGLKK